MPLVDLPHEGDLILNDRRLWLYSFVQSQPELFMINFSSECRYIAVNTAFIYLGRLGTRFIVWFDNVIVNVKDHILLRVFSIRSYAESAVDGD